MPTASTLPLVILVAILWKLTKGNVLAIVLFTSIFDAASAFNVGAVGVAPWIASLVICIAVKLISGHRPIVLKQSVNSATVLLLSIFICYAIVSSVLSPTLFHGLPVRRFATVEGLAWGPTNFAQVCYLLAVVVVFLLAVSRTPQEMESAIEWYVRGCVVVGFFALYQLANATVHIPYPNAVLYSNPSHVIFPAYAIGGLWRLNSTFPEASEMAGFVALALGFAGWDLVSRRIKMVDLAKTGLLLASLLFTFSTTGYLTLAFIVVVGLLIQGLRVFRRGMIAPSQLVFAIILCGAGVVIAAIPGARAPIATALSATILDKTDSDSYKSRTETHGTSLETARNTYLLGAGWGSVRPSGLFYVLIANVGIIGCLSFSGMVLSLYWPLRRARSITSHAQTYQRSLFGISIMLTAMLIAGAEPVTPVLWALFGIAAASVERKSHAIEADSLPPIEWMRTQLT